MVGLVSSKAGKEACPRPLPALAAAGVPWFIDGALPVSSHGLSPVFLSLCLNPPFHKDTGLRELGPLSSCPTAPSLPLFVDV